MSTSASALRFAVPPSLGYAHAQRLAQQIEVALAGVGQGQVSVTVAGSYEHLEALILGGAVDVAWVNPLLLARAQVAGATAHLRGVRHGSLTFRSALVMRRDEGADLRRMRDARAAWTDPDSLAGYRLPLRHLRRGGMEPGALFSSERFTFSYPAALEALLDGSADLAACFVHEADQDALQEVMTRLIGPEAARLEAVAFTDAVPNDAIVFGPHLGRAVADELCERTLAHAHTVAGRAVLEMLGAEELVRGRAGDGAALTWLGEE